MRIVTYMIAVQRKGLSTGRGGGAWVRSLGWGNGGRRGRVFLVLRVSGILVIFLQVTALCAETVKALPCVAFVGGKEIA